MYGPDQATAPPSQQESLVHYDLQVTPGQPVSQAPPMQQMSPGQPMPMGQGGMAVSADVLKSKPVLLLVAAAVLGVIAVGLSAGAYTEAGYFDSCTKAEAAEFSRFRSQKYSCESQLQSTAEHCAYLNEQVAVINQRFGREVAKPVSCPWKYFGVLPVFIIGITWGASLVLLIALVAAQQKSKQLVFIGTMICAVLYLLSALSLLIFIIWAAVSTFPCESDNEPRQSLDRPRPSQSHDYDDDNGQYSFAADRLKFASLKTCSDYRGYTYQFLLHAFAMIFAGVTAVALGVAVFMLNKLGRQGPVPLPMGGPVGQQGQPPQYYGGASTASTATTYSQPQGIRPPGY